MWMQYHAYPDEALHAAERALLAAAAQPDYDDAPTPPPDHRREFVCDVEAAISALAWRILEQRNPARARLVDIFQHGQARGNEHLRAAVDAGAVSRDQLKAINDTARRYCQDYRNEWAVIRKAVRLGAGLAAARMTMHIGKEKAA